MIPLFGGGEVRLDDLGTVTDTIADRRTFARFNGEPVVALGIKRSKGASDVVVAAAVQKRIDALKVAYPDVDLKLIDTSVEFTKGNYEAAISTLFEGATSRSSSCCSSCATCGPPSSPRSRCRCRSSRRSG